MAFTNTVEKVEAHNYPADERVSLNCFYHQRIQNGSRDSERDGLVYGGGTRRLGLRLTGR